MGRGGGEIRFITTIPKQKHSVAFRAKRERCSSSTPCSSIYCTTAEEARTQHVQNVCWQFNY